MDLLRLIMILRPRGVRMQYENVKVHGHTQVRQNSCDHHILRIIDDCIVCANILCGKEWKLNPTTVKENTNDRRKQSTN